MHSKLCTFAGSLLSLYSPYYLLEVIKSAGFFFQTESEDFYVISESSQDIKQGKTKKSLTDLKQNHISWQSQLT